MTETETNGTNENEKKTRATLDPRQRYLFNCWLDVTWNALEQACASRADVAARATGELGFDVSVSNLMTAEKAVGREWTGQVDPVLALQDRVTVLEEYLKLQQDAPDAVG